MSFRLGGIDGVSVSAATWATALSQLGMAVVTVAGEGPVDHLLPGLAWSPTAPPLSPGEVAAALEGAELVVVENLCSLPLNPGAADAVATALRGRPAILHHHDLPWQREHLGDRPRWPPQDPCWRHVTVNHLSRAQLAARGILATTIPVAIDVDQPPGDGHRARHALGLAADEVVLLHPVRAIARKAIPTAVALAEALRATYWLTGPAEEGYGPELARVLGAARCRVLHRPAPGPMADAYAAADAVVLPSRWEGFGVPVVEAAVHRRPLAVAPYPVARELAGLGFRWFPVDDPAPLARFLARPDPDLHEHNAAVVRRHLCLGRVVDGLAGLLDDMGLR